MNRRELLRSSALLGAVLAGGGPRRALAATNGYGPLVPVADDETGLPLLKLPEGFRYRSLSWAGDVMTDGMPTPDLHDGMGVLVDPRDPDAYVLMRNHERTYAAPFGAEALARYDRYAGPERFAGIGGGTTALKFAGGRYVETLPTLGGTLVNCAGGTTPWGSWLTCEEIVLTGQTDGARNHGYVFEVPAPWADKASARPIVAMGRMRHEAVGVDPATGFVYLTEDNGPSGFYRFRPRSSAREIGALEQGGTLEMLKVRGVDGADLTQPRAGDEHVVEWVPIADPDAPAENRAPPRNAELRLLTHSGRSGPFLQGRAQGAAEFRRLEGAFAHGGLVYFTDTVAGAARTGVLWALAPSASGDGPDRLRCVFVSSGEGEADNIDNLCVSPRGGIVLCEDGGGVRTGDGVTQGTRVVGLAADGTGAFPLAENNIVLTEGLASRPSIRARDYRTSEFAGVCFSPRGDRLYVNVQQPGVTFEIRGPWDGGLV